MNCFNKFVQTAVNACRQRDDNPNCSVVAETMKLLANNSYGYQFIDRSRQSITQYTNDGKTHSAINNEKFKRMGYINDQFYEVELANFEIEHKEPVIAGLSRLPYSTLS